MLETPQMRISKAIKRLFEGTYHRIVRQPPYVIHTYKDLKSHNKNKLGRYRVMKPSGFSGIMLREMRKKNGVGRPPQGK